MKIGKIATATLVLFVLTTATFAHKGATGIVKTRMDAMSEIGKGMKTISAMIKGKTEYDSAVVRKTSKMISKHARKFPELFPEGSTKAPSEAAPAIWENKKKFDSISADLAEYARQLGTTAGNAETGKALASEFSNMAGTCKSCHESFRIKK